MSVISKRLLAIVICTFFYSAINAAENTSFIDPKDLSANHLKLYQMARSILNDWTGGTEKLIKADEIIESFIKSQPNFLPIYIEKARYTIMIGYTGDNDTKVFNLRALDILKTIQKKAPNYAKSYVLAGHVYKNLKDYSNARDALITAETIGTTDPWLQNNWSDLLYAQGQYDEALDRTIKAISLSKDNAKALISAIVDLEKISPKTQRNVNEIDVVSIIFSTFDDPIKRLRIAENLVQYYGGRRKILLTAYQIISKQKQETPDLVLCDVELANLLLQSGYKYDYNHIRIFENQAMINAEKLLLSHQKDRIVNDRVFDMLVEIALSKNDYKKAEKLIKEAPGKGIAKDEILFKQATLQYITKHYEDAISTFEELFKLDSSYRNSVILMAAYDELGQFDKLEDYYLRLVDRFPESAWNQGEYARFLLFKKYDSASAIRHGEMALSIMEYPMAKNITGLAYLIEASKLLKRGDKEGALSYYNKGLSFGISEDYVMKTCDPFCTDIQKVKAESLKANRVTM